MKCKSPVFQWGRKKGEEKKLKSLDLYQTETIKLFYLNMDTSNQQHKCNHCGRGYARKDGLKRHEKSSKCGTLQQQQPTTCEICGSPLLHETLRDHCINYHSVYTTPICEDFAQICNPNKWLKPRKCPLCDKFFIHDPKLQSHISSQHSAANQVSDIKTFNKL